jgi:hypothetical protein
MVAYPGYQSLRHFRSVAEGYQQGGCEHQTCDHDSYEEAELATCQSLRIDHPLSGPQNKILLQHLAFGIHSTFCIHQSSLSKQSSSVLTLHSAMLAEIDGLLNKSETYHGILPDRVLRTQRLTFHLNFHLQDRSRSAGACQRH